MRYRNRGLGHQTDEMPSGFTNLIRPGEVLEVEFIDLSSAEVKRGLQRWALKHPEQARDLSDRIDAIMSAPASVRPAARADLSPTHRRPTPRARRSARRAQRRSVRPSADADPPPPRRAEADALRHIAWAEARAVLDVFRSALNGATARSMRTALAQPACVEPAWQRVWRRVQDGRRLPHVAPCTPLVRDRDAGPLSRPSTTPATAATASTIGAQAVRGSADPLCELLPLVSVGPLLADVTRRSERGAGV